MITVAPGKHRMPRRRGMAHAALSAANQRPALTDPDWPPDGVGSRPQWDGPPLLPPDHPSAPVPRVRAPLVPGTGGDGRNPAHSASLGFPRSRPNPGPRALLSARPTARGNGPRQDAEKDAAAIRQEATAMRDAAQKEAAHLRAVILSLSEQLSQLSAYIRENLASPGGLATMPAPAFAPPRPRTRPNAPAARPAGLAEPRRAPAKKQGARGRQQHAMRVAASLTAASFVFAVATGLTELALHGYQHFLFRPAGIGSGGTESDLQFVAQQAAAAKAAAAHKTHSPGRHSAKTTG